MMDYTEKQFVQLHLLLDRLFANELSSEEVADLQQTLLNDSELLKYYFRVVELQSGLQQMKNSAAASLSQEQVEDAFREFAEYEKTASRIEVREEEPKTELIQKVEYTKSPRVVSKLSIYSMIVSAAAIFLLVLFVRFMPPKGGLEVAVLRDTINAKWADMDMQLQRGTRISADGVPLLLREGLAELEFDNNARVVIEAPAEFQVLTEDRISLRYGKVYATVPKEAIGFSIYTSNAKVIDMGTEFGIEADTHGDTRLHVMKGKTMLIAGHKTDKASIEVNKGAAKKIAAVNSKIIDIPCDSNLFVRGFDSMNDVIWRQQPSLDLADIAGKGNGLGTGQSSVIIHPTKGYTKDSEYRFISPRGFLPIRENSFLDGIFVPHGGPDLIVSTRGDVFKGTPETSGFYSIDLVVNPAPKFFKTNLREGAIVFDEQLYGSSGKPCIAMHANIGLTFDLDAVRQSYHRNIKVFDSQIGIADLKEAYGCNADFWVLVDGKVRYSLQQYKEKGVLNDVSVEIKDTDRFLTLVTTDGGDPDDPGDFYTRANSCDWCVFTEPVLMLE